MASENLQLLHATLREVRHDGLRAILDAVHPDIEFEDFPQALEDRHRKGRAGIEDWIASIEQVWEEPRVETEEVAELDDRTLLVVYDFVARAKGSGIEVQQRLSNLFSLRDGLVIRWRIFLSREEAMEAVERGDSVGSA
jgi:ketosteroid isomerase-like protein